MSFDIDKVAALARIRLKPEEKAKLQKDLDSILAYVEKLKEINTDGVEPTSHVMDLENVFRPDVVQPSNAIEALLAQAPAREGKFFKVPKVVDRE